MKPAQVVDQAELDLARLPTPTTPTRRSTNIEEAVRLAIARRAPLAGVGDKVRLALTVTLNRQKAERFTRAIQGKNLEAPAAEILETASN